ncbi:MAG: hypothetical protein KJP04_08820, partial [Arenicella sp.]|nr:hypothetical protein [Arenicella sp.]
MKWKKRLMYLVLVLFVATAGFAVLANRDLVRMYGGLTQQVDSSQFSPLQGPLAINNVNVLSADSGRFIPAQTVIVENGLIKSIGRQPSPSDQLRQIDGAEKYLIPGLIDSHVHLFKSPNDLLLYVANGVTQIREMIGEPDHLAWRKELGAGRIGPDMYIASPRIGSFATVEGLFMVWSQGFLNLSTASEGEQAVKKLQQQGYDAVKIYSQVNKQTYRAITRTADSNGMRVVGHVPYSVEVADLYSHQQEIAHLEEIM